jgi:hypothetical protein
MVSPQCGPTPGSCRKPRGRLYLEVGRRSGSLACSSSASASPRSACCCSCCSSATTGRRGPPTWSRPARRRPAARQRRAAPARGGLRARANSVSNVVSEGPAMQRSHHQRMPRMPAAHPRPRAGNRRDEAARLSVLHASDSAKRFPVPAGQLIGGGDLRLLAGFRAVSRGDPAGKVLLALIAEAQHDPGTAESLPAWRARPTPGRSRPCSLPTPRSTLCSARSSTVP